MTHWKGSLKALRQRYVSILGKNMQVMLFHCQNRILTERNVFEKLKPWHIESELYIAHPSGHAERRTKHCQYLMSLASFISMCFAVQVWWRAQSKGASEGGSVRTHRAVQG